MLRAISGFTSPLLFFIICFSAPTFARDLQGRFGLGYNNQFISSVPSVSLKYGLARDIGMQLVAGTSSSNPSSSTFGGKLNKVLFFETNLNFYAMIGAGMVNLRSQSGVELMAGFGVEFFIPGLESLGLSVETGGSLNNTSGDFAFRTLGLSFIDAGIHFYF